HNIPLTAQTISQMVDKILSLPEGSRMMLLAPVVKARKGEHTKLLDNIAAQGYIRARIDGEICDLSEDRKSTRLNSSHVSISYAARHPHTFPTRRSSDLITSH